MALSDELSRFPNKRNTETVDLDIKVDFVQFSKDKKLLPICQANSSDQILCELRDLILRGWPNQFREVRQTCVHTGPSRINHRK